MDEPRTARTTLPSVVPPLAALLLTLLAGGLWATGLAASTPVVGAAASPLSVPAPSTPPPGPGVRSVVVQTPAAGWTPTPTNTPAPSRTPTPTVAARASLAIATPTTRLAVGDTVTLEVPISVDVPILGAQFGLTFDRSRVEILDVTAFPGTFVDGWARANGY